MDAPVCRPVRDGVPYCDGITFDAREVAVRRSGILQVWGVRIIEPPL